MCKNFNSTHKNFFSYVGFKNLVLTIIQCCQEKNPFLNPDS